MPIHVKPSKIEELIVYILNSLDRSLGSIELAKYIYLIDIESIRFTGSTITGQVYNRAPNGPLSADFKYSTTRLNGYEIDIEVINNINNSGNDKHCHKLGKNPRFSPELDPTEMAIANRVLTRHHDKEANQLKEIAYKTKPWKAVLEYEKKNKKEFQGAIDLTEEGKLPEVVEWEKQKRIKHNPDPEYEAYLVKEKKEVNDLLASFVQ